MQTLPWQKIILLILALTIVIGLSGCQSKLAKGVENSFEALKQVPDRLVQGISNVLGGIGDVGGALADSIKNVIGNMTGP